MPRRCAVLGSPISHSLSPVLHRAAYAALGLDWRYDAERVEATGLAGFLDGLGPEWRGLSLTMPLKEAAAGMCNRVDEPGRLTGAVNTVLLEPDGSRAGLNTDVTGFVAAWRDAGITHVGHAVLVGAGATARSAVAALAATGTERVSVLARSAERAERLVALIAGLDMTGDVGPLVADPLVARFDLLVSAVPASAHGALPAGLTDRLVDQADAVCDVVYSPGLTPFVAAARRAGLPCVEGFDLLLHQAGRQVELMTGCAVAPLEAMRAAGLAELARRGSGA